ncbi:alpha-ketoglutarate permease [Escherichia coli]|nr:alpha-ketoglutarate permease [Escherichia coli]EFO2218559.1 alpha-ketoglutarate permease [Escherichia coli O11]EFO3098429.1 alpha-ketoglutarate permease [Escherichia coli O153]AXZ42552.1 alpha-ketoglutarate permease [Escherichia coli]EFO0047077.1 alpha-ketoglutarate permease [Escherichia coli]
MHNDTQQMYNIFLPKKINNSDRQKHRITAGDIMAWLKVL